MIITFEFVAKFLKSKLNEDVLAIICQFLALDKNTKLEMKNCLNDVYEHLENYHNSGGEIQQIERELLTPLKAHKAHMLLQFDTIIKEIGANKFLYYKPSFRSWANTEAKIKISLIIKSLWDSPRFAQTE